MTYAHEIRVLDEHREVKVWHRIYYHEPDACPTELWAMSAGCKVEGDASAAAQQQQAIDRARTRVAFTDRFGRGLEYWPVT